MTLQSSTRIFILLGLAFSAVQSITGLKRSIPETGHELGFDGCSHHHFVIVDHFLQEEILKNLSHAKLSYEFKKCNRETPVGSVFRNYNFDVQIGSALCKFSFNVADVDTHITYDRFSPLEIQDMNHCKSALHEAYFENPDLAPLLSNFEDTNVSNPVQTHAEELREVFETAPVQEFENQIKEDLTPSNKDISIQTDEQDEEEEIDYRTYIPVHQHEQHEQQDEIDPRAQYAGIKGLFKEHSEVDYGTYGIFDNDETDKVEEIGSTEEIVFHNQKASTQPVEDEEKPIVHREDPNDSRAIGGMAGGWTDCKRNSKLEAQKLLTELANLNVLKAVITYTENITKCQLQVVAGMNYKLELSYNDDVCNLVIYEALDGKVQIGNNFKTTKACAGYFTESYVAANPSVVEP